MIPDLDFEKSLIPSNCRFLLGIDEVGRGPWAGPVSVGAFLLDLKSFDPDFFINNVRDSKTLSLLKRKDTFKEINKRNYIYKVSSASSTQIDEVGIQKTIIKLIKEIITDFHHPFDYVLVDGNMNLDLTNICRSVVKGDATCFSMAAASICAKVIRDEEMNKYAKIFPGYDFENNKGYGTPAHIEGLNRLGICPIHRLSYQPIKNYSSAR